MIAISVTTNYNKNSIILSKLFIHLNNYNIPFHYTFYSPLYFHEKMISSKYCWNLFYCIFLVVNSTKAEKALINEEKVDLIQNLLRWMKGFDVLAEQRCFTLNFGYQQPFPFPQLWLELGGEPTKISKALYLSQSAVLTLKNIWFFSTFQNLVQRYRS